MSGLHSSFTPVSHFKLLCILTEPVSHCTGDRWCQPYGRLIALSAYYPFLSWRLIEAEEHFNKWKPFNVPSHKHARIMCENYTSKSLEDGLRCRSVLENWGGINSKPQGTHLILKLRKYSQGLQIAALIVRILATSNDKLSPESFFVLFIWRQSDRLQCKTMPENEFIDGVNFKWASTCCNYSGSRWASFDWCDSMWVIINHQIKPSVTCMQTSEARKISTQSHTLPQHVERHFVFKWKHADLQHRRDWINIKKWYKRQIIIIKYIWPGALLHKSTKYSVNITMHLSYS